MRRLIFQSVTSVFPQLVSSVSGTSPSLTKNTGSSYSPCSGSAEIITAWGLGPSTQASSGRSLLWNLASPLFNDRRAAKQNLVEALSIDSNNPRALAALGKIREETGEYAQALEDYQRSYAQDGFQPQLATRIAALRSQLNPAMAGSSSDSGTRLVEQGSKPPLR